MEGSIKSRWTARKPMPTNTGVSTAGTTSARRPAARRRPTDTTTTSTTTAGPIVGGTMTPSTTITGTTIRGTGLASRSPSTLAIRTSTTRGGTGLGTLPGIDTDSTGPTGIITTSGITITTGMTTIMETARTSTRTETSVPGARPLDEAPPARTAARRRGRGTPERRPPGASRLGAASVDRRTPGPVARTTLARLGIGLGVPAARSPIGTGRRMPGSGAAARGTSADRPGLDARTVRTGTARQAALGARLGTAPTGAV